MKIPVDIQLRVNRLRVSELAAIIDEAAALRRLWRDRQGTSDDAYGAAAEAFWKKIDALDPLTDVRAALPAGESCADDDARAFVIAEGAKLGEEPPW